MRSENRKLVVAGVPEHFNLPWHLCVESDAFKDAGIAIDYVEVAGGTGAMTGGLAEKEFDMAIVLAEGGVASLLKGNPSSIIKTYVSSPLIWGIHVAAESDIQNVEEIRDRRYAISRYGSGSHLMAIVDAAERGWSASNLKFVEIGDLAGARQALSNRDADVFFWERFTTEPFVESGEFRRVGERRTLWPAFVVCARNEVLNEQAANVRTVLEIVNQACQELMNSRDACSMISERYELRLNEVEQWFAQTQWSTDFKKPNDAIKNIENYLLKLEIVTAEQCASREVWFDLANL